jgi:hypothetical protein
MADGSLRITVEFEPRFAKEAFALFGGRGSPLAVAAIKPEAALSHAQASAVAAVTREPNRLAQGMMINGYFRNPKLWEAMDSSGIYTQDEHKAFIESQVCCFRTVKEFTGRLACNGDVVGHHVRTAANSGTGMKPPHWFLVPLCHVHHDNVHGAQSTREDKELLLREAIELTATAIRRAMREHLGLDSMNELTAAMLTAFELEIGL